MAFDSVTFWIFFGVAWVLWRFLPFALAKTATLLMSLLFYGWWNPWYLPLIAFSALVDYTAGAKIHASQNPKTRRAWLTVSLVSNLGLLAIFKYGHFAVSNAVWLAKIFGLHFIPPEVHWVIPVGISFYTFQTMSYTLDIYRRQLTPAKSFRDFFLFVAFFPQLVAGPIVRARVLLPQLERRRRLLPVAVETGIYYIVWGLFMKIVVADNLAHPVDEVFGGDWLDKLSPATVWLGVIYFSVQIFADFAGYSSIAIGLAYLMGVRFDRNFNYPYISASLSEFWTRWHISLSQWLRDYLYISLGGNRKGKARVYANIMITMLLGGLWHGASWTFVAWGLLHGIGLCVERLLFGRKKRRAYTYREAGKISLPAALRRVIAIIAVYVFTLVAWVFFRAPNFTLAGEILHKMFIVPWFDSFGPVYWKRFLLCVLPVALFHLGQLQHEWLGVRKRAWMRAVLTGVMLFLLLVVARMDRNVFIYFQF